MKRGRGEDVFNKTVKGRSLAAHGGAVLASKGTSGGQCYFFNEEETPAGGDNELKTQTLFPKGQIGTGCAQVNFSMQFYLSFGRLEKFSKRSIYFEGLRFVMTCETSFSPNGRTEAPVSGESLTKEFIQTLPTVKEQVELCLLFQKEQENNYLASQAFFSFTPQLREFL